MGNCASKDKERGKSSQYIVTVIASVLTVIQCIIVADVSKAIMGNSHSNDYRPDPTRADRIRNEEKMRNGEHRGGSAEAKKNGFRGQLSVSQSPSHVSSSVSAAPASGVGRNLKGRVVIALYTYQVSCH